MRFQYFHQVYFTSFLSFNTGKTEQESEKCKSGLFSHSNNKDASERTPKKDEHICVDSIIIIFFSCHSYFYFEDLFEFLCVFSFLARSFETIRLHGWDEKAIILLYYSNSFPSEKKFYFEGDIKQFRFTSPI